MHEVHTGPVILRRTRSVPDTLGQEAFREAFYVSLFLYARQAGVTWKRSSLTTHGGRLISVGIDPVTANLWAKNDKVIVSFPPTLSYPSCCFHVPWFDPAVWHIALGSIPRLRARMMNLHPHFLRIPRIPAFRRPFSQVPISRTVITRTRIQYSLPPFLHHSSFCRQANKVEHLPFTISLASTRRPFGFVYREPR